jgi:hypothetical protein
MKRSTERRDDEQPSVCGVDLRGRAAVKMFGVGPPRTGTLSLASSFPTLRCAHEPEAPETIGAILRDEPASWWRDRCERLHLDLEVAHPHQLLRVRLERFTADVEAIGYALGVPVAPCHVNQSPPVMA